MSLLNVSKEHNVTSTRRKSLVQPSGGSLLDGHKKGSSMVKKSVRKNFHHERFCDISNRKMICLK